MSSKQPVLDNKFQANLDYSVILSPKEANKHKQISEEALEPQTTGLNSVTKGVLTASPSQPSCHSILRCVSG